MKRQTTIIKFLAALIVFICCNSLLFGQQVQMQDELGKVVKEIKEVKDVQLSKAELLKIAKEEPTAFSEKKKKVKGIVKFDEPDKFAEFQRSIRTGDGQSEPGYKVGYQDAELQKLLLSRPLGKVGMNLNWIERGPGNVSGRTRGIVIEPRVGDHKTWIVGSVGGGIWKTTNAGATWDNKTPEMPNLATTVLAQAASSPNRIYCGTGEGFYNADAVNGGGIYVSNNTGNSWSLLPSTANSNFKNVNRIIVDPNQPDIVLAATNEGPAGIWRSTNGGINWTRVFTGSSRVQDLRATPGNFLIQYATVNGVGVYKSVDGGLTWTKSSFGLVAGSRYEICVSPKNPDVIFASVEVGSGSALAYSNNAAASWSVIQAATGTTPNWLNGQGWYDNTIEAHPYNQNAALFGGIDLWKAELTSGQTASNDFLGIDLNNTSWIQWINWGGPFNGGSIGKSIDFYNWTFKPYEPTYSTSQLSSNYVTCELRFGPGKSQKAHVFYRQATNLWAYKGYVTVPFEVWDLTNNRQLMVSFRDGNNNGAFDLNGWDGGGAVNGLYACREYIMVHAKPYDAAAPDPEIAVDNGVVNKMLYAFWGELLTGASWNPNSIPVSTIRINYGEKVTKYATFTPITDGYSQYSSYSPKPQYIHVDQHNIIVIPIDEATNKFWIVNGNDGGVAYSTDSGLTWSGNAVDNNVNNGGYVTTQFYGVDKKPGASEYIGGTQDNGTWLSPKGVAADLNAIYSRPIGGDGFDVAWHYTDPNKIIGGYQFNGFYRTTNGGTNWISASNGLTDNGSGKGCFISKLGESNSDPDVIFTTGVSGIWRSEDFGANWTKSTLTGWAWSSLSTPVAVSIADPQIVWGGYYLSSGSTYLYLSQDGGLTFTAVPKLTIAMGGITGIDTHPTDPNTAYLSYSISGAPKVLKTTNLGQTWADITGFTNGVSTTGFPDVATYCVVVMPFNTNWIWVGTEIGLMESYDGGASWHLANNGLPAVCIWDMKIVDDQVVVATHGRGIISVTLPELAGYRPPVAVLSPVGVAVAQTTLGTLNVQANFRSAYDSTKVFIDGVQSYKALNTVVGQTTLSVSTTKSGTVNVQVVGYKANRGYKSAAVSTSLLSYKPVQNVYANNFNAATTDFAGTGFTLTKPAGFSSNAINSVHPYVINNNYTYTLLVPIKVAAANSFVEYDDVAIVEPGDPGTKFGDEAFWDYVVVEGTKDGITWTPVADGYDCQYNSRWQAIFGTSTNPDSTYYMHHKFDLKSKFAVGDQVVLRFRLFSDAAAVGWGWIIDNLAIQQNPVGIEKVNSSLPTQFALMQNYPNPFNPSTNIKFQLPQAEHVKLEIYDSIGRLIETMVDTKLEAGYYSYKWNARGYASGVYLYRITAGTFTESKKLNFLK